MKNRRTARLATLILAFGLMVEATSGAQPAAARIRARIVNEDGRPLKDAKVEISRADTGIRTFFTTSDNGVVDANAPRPGPARIVVRRTGYAAYLRSEVTIVNGVTDLGTIRMKRGYRVKITAPPATGTSNDFYRVHVRGSRGEPIDPFLDDSSASVIPSGGVGVVGLLAPGSYTIELAGRRRTSRGVVQIDDADGEITLK